MNSHQNYSILIDAEIRGDFALHKSPLIFHGLENEYNYTVTHVPTKGKIFEHDNKETCQEFLDKILTLDWSPLNHNDCSEDCEYIHAFETGKEIFADFDKFLAIKSEYI